MFELLKQAYHCLIRFAQIAPLVTAIGAIIIAYKQNRIHRDSNKPYCDIWCVDYKNEISVSIRNNGTGVMQITDFTVYKGQEIFKGLYKHNCIDKSVKLNYYSVDIIKRSIKPFGELKLIEKTEGRKAEFTQLRNDLKKCKIEIKYVDMYNKQMPICKKELFEIYGKKHRQQINKPTTGGTRLQHIYIVLSNNYTSVGKIICLREKLHFGRHDAGAAYSHASLSLDSGLHNMLSFARKTIHNPFNAGLVKEDISAGMFALKPEKSRIVVIKLPVAEQQYTDIEKLMNHYWNNRDSYKYNSKGLIRILLHGRDKSDMSNKNAFFCSEWVDYLLKQCGIDLFKDKNLYTVSPSDFYHTLKDNIIYEGLTKEYSRNAGIENAPYIL